MTEIKFKIVLNILLVIIHIVFVFAIVLLYFKSGFTLEEVTTLTAIIFPAMAVYISSIIKSIIDEDEQTNLSQKKIGFQKIVVILLFLSSYITLILGGIILKAYNIYSAQLSFEFLKIMIAIAETTFGVPFSQLFFSIYKKA